MQIQREEISYEPAIEIPPWERRRTPIAQYKYKDRDFLVFTTPESELIYASWIWIIVYEIDIGFGGRAAGLKEECIFSGCAMGPINSNIFDEWVKAHLKNNLSR